MAAPSGQHRSGFVLGVDLGGTKTALVSADLAGNRLHTRQFPTRAHEGADRVMSRLLDAARDVISETVRGERGAGHVGGPDGSGGPRGASGAGGLTAVGAVSPGIVLDDQVLLAPNNPGWDTLALAGELRRGLEVDRVVVDTDAKAAAVAEARWGMLAGVGTGMFLNLGTGISAAVITGGRVLRGAHAAAGEIGYQLLGLPGEIGFAAGRAPLEEHVSGRAIGERASALLGREVSAAEAFALSSEDVRVRDLIADALDVLAVHVTNMTIALDPERIVVGGGLMGSAATVLSRLEAVVSRSVPFPPKIVVARFRGDAPLAGAVALALDATLALDGSGVGSDHAAARP